MKRSIDKGVLYGIGNASRELRSNNTIALKNMRVNISVAVIERFWSSVQSGSYFED